jgi:hypothetical protein
MSYPKDYFQEPKRERQKKLWQRRGIVAEVETTWGTYTIYQKSDKVWIEAFGWGGARKRMPQVNTVEEAKEAVWQRTKPLPKDDAISF